MQGGELMLLALGVVLGLAVENTIQIAVLKYRFNTHLKMCGKTDLLED